MGQVLHGSATTTEAIRRAIQDSQESLRSLAKRYGINPKTVAKWKKRQSVRDLPTGPKDAKSTVLSIEEEAIIVAFRRHTLLPLDDCLYALYRSPIEMIRSGDRQARAALEPTELSQRISSLAGRYYRRRSRAHAFELACAQNDIDHRLTKPKHPWTNGQVENMNRTIKEATVKRFFYDNHAQFRGHLDDFVLAYNFAKRLKTLKGLTPYEYICKIWTTEPQRFKLNPIHQRPGLNI